MRLNQLKLEAKGGVQSVPKKANLEKVENNKMAEGLQDVEKKFLSVYAIVQCTVYNCAFTYACFQ